MTFTTKLNIGDTIWRINEGQIVTEEIDDIRIFHHPNSRDFPNTEIIYSTKTCGVYENKEGVYWWRTKEELVNYLLSQL